MDLSPRVYKLAVVPLSNYVNRDYSYRKFST